MSVDEKSRAYWLSLPTMRITMAEATKLLEYSASNPSGAYPGKRWRRHNGAFDHRFKALGGIPRWVICTYEEIPDDPKHVKNGVYRAVIRVPMRRHIGEEKP